MTSYLQELTLRLAVGASTLDRAIRDQHARWLRAQQRPDGGFAGREGESDPYYTAFALRSLWILGELDESIGGRAAAFLRSRLDKRESIIDMISLIFAAAICEMAVGEVVLVGRGRGLARQCRPFARFAPHQRRRIREDPRRPCGQHVPDVFWRSCAMN